MTAREKPVYICSPLSAPTEEGIRENMMKARQYMAIVADNFGCRAVAPHAYLPELLDDSIPAERSLGLSFGLSLLELCSAMIVCGEIITNGMKGEIVKARSLKLPVFHMATESEGVRIEIYKKEKENEM